MDLWDPLLWILRMKQITLRYHGFHRRRFHLRSTHFGSYARQGPDGSLPLVLVHGLALFPEWWSPVLKSMPNTHSVYVPELLGFGRSPGRNLAPTDFCMQLYRDQFNELKRYYGWDRMILAGVSLGGWICLDYALAHPDSVDSLILMGPSGANPGVEETDLLELKEIFDYQTAEEFDRLMNEYVFHKPKPLPRWVGKLAVERAVRNGHKNLLNNLVLEDWVGDRVSRIEHPTALIWGRQDKVFPFEVGQAMEKMMPRARLFPMEDTGHSYLFERPYATSRAFMEALEFVEK